jgi:hypothetical protein
MQSTRRLLLLSPLLLTLAAVGCASVDRGLKLRLDSLIGKANKEEMIERYGEPVQKTTVDSHTDVWEFVASDQSVGTGSSAALKTSTRLRVTFKDGVMSAWTAYNAVR